MKVVLRHKITGRYYLSPRQWVRRADNALVFEDLDSAEEFCQRNNLQGVQPVQRLAPYLMPLIGQHRQSLWTDWEAERSRRGYLEHANKFNRN